MSSPSEKGAELGLIAVESVVVVAVQGVVVVENSEDAVGAFVVAVAWEGEDIASDAKASVAVEDGKSVEANITDISFLNIDFGFVFVLTF